jgi:hypothetical protein
MILYRPTFIEKGDSTECFLVSQPRCSIAHET